LRRGGRTELAGGRAIGTDNYSYAIGHRYAANAGDKSGSLSSHRADAHVTGLANTTSVADIDIVTAGADIGTSYLAQCDVAVASCVLERSNTDGRVVAAGGVGCERTSSVGRVEVAGGVVFERSNTVCRVLG